MKKIDWIHFRIGRITLTLFVLAVFFLFFYLPDRYKFISIILIIYVIFFLFLSVIILRQKVKIDFPSKSNKEKESSGNFRTKNTIIDSNHPLDNFPQDLQKTMYKPEYLIINQRIFYPFLDIICGAIALMIAVVLLLINILNLIPIITLIILYWFSIDKISKKRAKNVDYFKT